ncbi:RHS repeat-associated core domain-containing protein, partial [Weeksellaceae bacterium A-14]
REYMPIPQSGSSNGAIYSQTSGLVNFPVSNSGNYYPSSERIFSEKALENSPLDRVLGLTQPGSSWEGHAVQYAYQANNANEVLKIITTSIYSEGISKATTLTFSGYYAGATLYKNKITDEDGNVSYEFKNGQGQVLLVRKELSTTTYADTYYVYNEYDQLAFVISPLASDSFKSSPN